MKLFLDSRDAIMAKMGCKADLRALIEAAGHTAIIKQIEQATVPEVTQFDYILAMQQTNFSGYQSLLFRKQNLNLQSELQMLDKSLAYQTLDYLGLNYLSTKTVFSVDDIVNFESDPVILKPVTGMVANSVYDFVYIVMPKSELIEKINASDINLSSGEYIVQEGITNEKPMLWIGGYVNPNGEIYVDGLLHQEFVLNNRYFEDAVRNPFRYEIKIEEVPLNEMDEFFEEAIRQIKIVLNHFNAKSTPFCIQAIVDDQNQVQLLDFNFGFGKAYALKAREKTPQYIIDRLKYTYGGADSIPPNNTYITNLIVNTPTDIPQSVRDYISDKTIYFAVGADNSDKDSIIVTPGGSFPVYRKDQMLFLIVGSSREDAWDMRDKFQTFLSTVF